MRPICMKVMLRRLLPLWAVLGLALLLVAASGNALVAQKAIARLLLPAGFLWLAAWAAIFSSRLEKGSRFGAAGFFLLYLVPQGRGFRDVQTALWEFLGRAR